MNKLSLVERLKQRKENSNNIQQTTSIPQTQKLSLAERIKIKNKTSSIEQGSVNETENASKLSLQQKLALKKRGRDDNTQNKSSKPQNEDVTKPEQDNSQSQDPLFSCISITTWFMKVKENIYQQSKLNPNIPKKRKLNGRETNKTTTNGKIDDNYYGIIYPFTNMQKTAIGNFSKLSPDGIILAAHKQAELNSQALKNMTLEDRNIAKAPLNKSSNDAHAIKFIKENYLESPHLSLCILGHIDSGKSTLTGRLLLDTQAVTKQQVAALQKQSKELGKQSFWLAWLMDSDNEERERGITKKFGYARFQSPKGYNYTLLDAPGHSDYISSTIIAIQQSNVCTIVVDCSIGGFESSFAGQLKEHLLLASKFVGNVNDLVFAMNKMDSIDWDEKRYLEIKEKIKLHMITDLEFEQDVVNNIHFIPVSSIKGENVVEPLDKLNFWYKGPSFIEILDEKNAYHLNLDFPEITPEYINQKDSLAIVLDNQQQNKNNSTKQKGKDASLTVKVINGYFTKSDKVQIYPRLSSKSYDIDDIWTETKESTNKNLPFAIKNQFVTLKIKNCNIDMISVGDIISLSSNSSRIQSGDKFQLKVDTFNMDRPLLPGSPIIVYMNDVEIPCTVSSVKVIKEINNGDEVIKKKMKHLSGNTKNAIINIEIQEFMDSMKAKDLGFSGEEEKPTIKQEEENKEEEILQKHIIPIFTSKENKQLSKVMIRKDGKTIAFGEIKKRLD
ncbi:hypothetical protein ACO0R3_003143 [Hanseniaspora guilliermondii]